MSEFICPRCQKPTLEIRTGVDLPPDERDDEIAVQAIGCTGCQAAGVAIYQESRRGALDEEHWSHTGYWLPEAEARHFAIFLQTCATDQAADAQLREWYTHQFAGSPYSIDWRSGFSVDKQ